MGQLLNIGQLAPDFTVHDDEGNLVQLREVMARGPLVLVFYPADRTPVCTAQLCELRDNHEAFLRAGVQVYGVNPGGAASHRAFREKHDFPFPLLVDHDHALARAYGCKGLLWTQRTVYAINADGRIAFAQRGHPRSNEIVDALRG